MSARRIRVAGALLGALVMDCAPAEVPATQLVVTIDAESSVLARLHHVRATLHATDATGGAEGDTTHDFELARSDSGVATAGVDVPFTFAVTRGAGARVKLVVQGFDSAASDAAPVIEQKLIAAFEPERALHVRVRLEPGCLDMPNPCSDLDRTCWAGARACAPVTEAAATREPIASAPDAGAPVPGCPTPSPCAAEYPCTPSPAGYACLGQRAAWPVTGVVAGGPSPFDTASIHLVRDKITNLVWQRERPLRYEGCTGNQTVAGDLCTADEARVYCSRLRLAERSWRLPSKAELETLVDYAANELTIDGFAFPATANRSYWTSSPQPRAGAGAEPVAVARYWAVNFRTAASMASGPTEALAVRCVSGASPARGTPDAQYAVDADTVRDRDTGLRWRLRESDPLPTLDEATRHCAELGGGWRLPHVKELLTTIDPARIDPALAAAFPAPRSGLAWAVVNKRGGDEGWVVDELLGSAYPHAVADRQRDARHASAPTPHARCVRDAEEAR